MSLQPKRKHGPDVKCAGSPICPDCSESQLEGLFNMEPLKTPTFKLYVSTIAEGQVVFHVQHPDKPYNLESPFLYLIQKFCDIHSLEFKDQVKDVIKSRLVFNSENQSYSVNPLKVNVDDFMAVRNYIKQIENDIK
jgi:hypothetical protein